MQSLAFAWDCSGQHPHRWLSYSLRLRLLPKGCIAVVHHCPWGILPFLVVICTCSLVLLLPLPSSRCFWVGLSGMNLSTWKPTYKRVFFGPLYGQWRFIQDIHWSPWHNSFHTEENAYRRSLNSTLKLPSFHFPREIRMTSSNLEVSKMSHTRWDVGSHIGRDSSYIVHIGTDNTFFPASQLFIWQGSFKYLILRHGWLSEQGRADTGQTKSFTSNQNT